jgi:porphobilinogen synthase
MLSETDLRAAQLVWPVFVMEGKKLQEQISSMPGVSRFSMDELLLACEQALKLGVSSVALFPKIAESKKDPAGKESLHPEGLVSRTVQLLKKELPELSVITDVALDPFSSDGHDGIVKDGKIVNDASVELLAKMAVVQAASGADFVAPSDMMDGRVSAIRAALDSAGFQEVGIISYAAKYASSFYGPFRDALDSAPKAGDKKTYQMDFRNSREALREVHLDVAEGADIVMVKPAGAYLDVIQKVRAAVEIPVAAYQVSGEYAMIKAAEQAGYLNGPAAMEESLFAIRRAGADLIFTYFALEMAKRL